MDILIVQVARQKFALETKLVREVIRAVQITPIPRLAPIFDGVLNLRGEAVPLLNVRTLFSLPSKPLDPDELFVVLDLPRRVIALRVESVQGPLVLSERELQEGKSLAPELEYVTSLATTAQGLLLLLDPATLPTQAEPVALEELLGESLHREKVE